MEKQRKIKILSITALVVALCALTIGFSAFSTTLNISSSAEVTPSGTDFKIKIYGVPDKDIFEDIMQGNISIEEAERSDIKGAGVVTKGKATLNPETATINNETLTISNINVTFQADDSEVIYGFIIKNEGKYDAYLDISSIIPRDDGTRSLRWGYEGTCSPENNTTPELVEATCDYIEMAAMVIDENTFLPRIIAEDYYVIPKGESRTLGILVKYKTAETLADGPFNVQFPDVKLNFSTAKFEITE